MDAPGPVWPEVEFMMGCGYELVSLLIVVSQQRLAAAHMAEEKQHMPVADGPEVGASPIIPNQSESVSLYKGM